MEPSMNSGSPPPARYILPNGKKVALVEFVRHTLREPDLEDEVSPAEIDEWYDSDICWNSDAPPKLDELLAGPEPEGILQAVRAWLTVEAGLEEWTMDWSLEYCTRYPRFRLDQLSGGDRAVDAPTALELINAYPEKLEDLVAPLRRGENEGTHTAKETYQSLFRTLLGWNEAVKSEPSEVAEREFRRVLRERWDLSDRLSMSYSNPELLTENDPAFYKAMHAYRPETENFPDQKPYNMMAVVLAHRGLMEPDVDFKMKEHMVQAMWGEQLLHFSYRNAHLERKIAERVRRAKVVHDNAEADRLGKRKIEFYHKTLSEAGVKVFFDVRTAWHNVIKKLTYQIEVQAQMQAGQKWFASTLFSDIPDVLRKQCEEGELGLSKAIRQKFDDTLGAESTVIEGASTIMRSIQDQINISLAKIKKWDGDDAGEMYQMMEAVREEGRRVERMAVNSAEHADSFQISLEELRQAAYVRSRAYRIALDELIDESEKQYECQTRVA
ncbi:hypothetical protein BCR34DRAFT_557312 [Clohesyomyces aquaticus]|uniref:Uncharacterized protein n=1 Tax=Clohesyomyces aquaticus TaxID=1231657 RepID=A0A1Y2A1U4_9PLEO|nr:hypothetical protein BCR34DRAFT_557312 [Clohesyomyces aquaticus]